MTRKMTKAQMASLRSVACWGGNNKPYMPYASAARSYEACARRGLLVYCRIDDGYPYNGYMLTPAGRAALSEAGHE